MPHQDRLNIAVFIDFDNIEIGVKTTLNEHFDVGTILDAIKERGEVITKIAYADWTRAGEYSRALTQHAIRLVQRNLTPGGDKNGADINLALDALEMAFTHPHINAYVIVGGDSDFLSLVEKLKQYDKKVFVVGGRGFTSVILQRNCHEFIAYENLAGVRKPVAKGGRPAAATASTPIAQAFAIVRRALKILSDREVTPQTGLLKSTLLQLDSTFSERNYGANSFLDFVEKLAHAGLVQLRHAGRSVMVELNEHFDEGGRDATGAPAAFSAGEPQETAAEPGSEPQAVVERPSVAATGSNADGVREVAHILSSAAQARWPMYLRNVKQLLRNAEGGFDERRYGFGGLMDLLRACQREGIIRLERDRRGGLRVFPGANLQRAVIHDAAPQPAPAAVETAPGEEFAPVEVHPEGEPAAIEPQPIAAIDTTAELLGTARRKRSGRPTQPRARRVAAAANGGTTQPAGGRTRKAAAPRKSGSPRRPRTKKAIAADTTPDTDAS